MTILMTLENKIIQLSKEIESCKKCKLYKTRNKVVIGEGSINSKILFIGEAPGANEDIQGKPFVGRAGKILDELLNSINITRNEIYITNILKCRPPKNRDPLKKEKQVCTNFLDKQIKLINPRIIVPMGNHAASFIFKKFGLKYDKITNVHGEIYKINTKSNLFIIIPAFHPAVSTYNPNTKKILFNDFKIIKKQSESF